MNRSILIVICDFLLLSLLTFSTDINRMADENTQPPTKVVVATNSAVTAGADLAAVMQRALEEERKLQTQLEQQFAQIRSTTTQQQSQLGEREQENFRLQQQFAAAQTNVENLSRQLQTTSAEAQQSQLESQEWKQKLAEAQADAQRQAQQAAALRQQLDALAKSNQLALTEKQRLGNQLQLAEAEQRAAAERATLLLQEVQATHAENAKLAEGFQTLATNSSQLTQEIRENRALAPNTIFSEFVSNRVTAGIFAARTGWFGSDASKSKQTGTILVTNGTNDIALCHVQDTPLTLWDPGTDWDKFTGRLTWQAAQVTFHSLAFNEQDPRVVMFPVAPAEARQLGCKIYRVSSDPYKFQDAVLVGADEGYYGECNFQIDLDTPHYVKLDRSLLRGLFGKFNPSRGDLVFSRTGELLGIMVNNTYCLTIRNFAATTSFPFDENLRNRHTGGILAQLYRYVFQMPMRLQ